MKHPTRLLLLLSAFLLYTLMPLQAQSNADEQAVKAAMLDYVEGLYEADAGRIRQSVHPELAKRGFWRPADEEAYADLSPMTFDELVDLAGRWNADGWLPDDAPKEITLFELKDKTASGKVHAHWGTDYMHLAKVDGRWYIMNVLWQSPMPTDAQAN